MNYEYIAPTFVGMSDDQIIKTASEAVVANNFYRHLFKLRRVNTMDDEHFGALLEIPSFRAWVAFEYTKPALDIYTLYKSKHLLTFTFAKTPISLARFNSIENIIGDNEDANIDVIMRKYTDTQLHLAMSTAATSEKRARNFLTRNGIIVSVKGSHKRASVDYVNTLRNMIRKARGVAN